jgi:hypothetical protein
VSSFTSALIVEDLEDGKNWRVHSPFEYHVGRYPSNEVIKVPKDFVTDFASTPWGLRWIVPVHGKHGKAAVLHDFLCKQAKEGIVSRKYADEIFYEAMGVLKVPKWRKYAAYFAVRTFAIVKGLK